MTEIEQRCVRALSRVTFYPGSGAKKFVSDMSGVLSKDPKSLLTAKQRRYLLDLTVRYGRQVKDAKLLADVNAELNFDTSSEVPA